jgi:hypothetical protein
MEQSVGSDLCTGNPLQPKQLLSSTGLTKLHDVTLRFSWRARHRWGNTNQSLDGMIHFLDSITGLSRLNRLKITLLNRTEMWNNCPFGGERLITGILAKHAKTLNVLCLPQFHPPKGTFTRIFSCPSLQKLSIGVTRLLVVRVR